MRILVILICSVVFASCSSSLRLAVPNAFREQASMMHVEGARGKKMSFGKYTSSKIKRGLHISYPGWGRGFLLENLALSRVGLQKEEHVRKEKDKFRFSLTDGTRTAHVFARESQLSRSIEYSVGKGNGFLNSYDHLQEYRYVFSAEITTDTLNGNKTWELMMSNIYDRQQEQDNSIFTIVKPDDNGIATNGQDTIFIKGLNLKKTETSDGRIGNLPIKLLSGYELSTRDGVIAIVDVIDRNIWMYNELDAAEKLTIGAISTAIFARRVKDVKW